MTLAGLAPRLRQRPDHALPVPAWFSRCRPSLPRADAILSLLRQLGQHGGVLAPQTLANRHIHHLVYADLGLHPPPDHALRCRHMHTILQLHAWLDKHLDH